MNKSRMGIMAVLLALALQVSGCMTPAQRFPSLYQAPEPYRPVARPAEQPPVRQALYRLVLATPTQASGGIELVKFRDYLPEGTITLQDGVVEWTFTYTKLGLEVPPLALGFKVANKSDETVEIDWNKTVIVDVASKSHRVIHNGVKIADRSAIMATSVIPGGNTRRFSLSIRSILFFEWMVG